MPNYHRTWLPGGTYFFTVVTNQRVPIFDQEFSRQILRAAFLQAGQKIGPFQIDALCLLPDHLHCIWTLLNDDKEYAKRWQVIKSYFSHHYVQQGGSPGLVTPSKVKKGEVGIWQRRYWEHTIRDIVDLQRHIDYIHYNPVKHGLVSAVKAWPWSTFRRFVQDGYYNLEWGTNPPSLDGLVIGE